MKYHFKIYEEDSILWADCIELEGCRTQGGDLEDLKKNIDEAMFVYLDEPYESLIVFPLPDVSIKDTNNIIGVEVDAKQALSIIHKNERF